MAKGSLVNKKSRQDELLNCLRDRSYWITKDLCEQLSVSHRTLMRDLSELKLSGVPIESERGRGGGIRLNGRWGLGRLQLNNTEVISLLLALVISEAIKSPILVDNLSSIKNRISSAFPAHQRQQIEQLRSRILVGDRASESTLNSYQLGEHETNLMTSLSQSFMDMKMVTIKYQSEHKEFTTRTIEPQMFLLNWPAWYLLAWDTLRNDVRMFRIDRIQAAQQEQHSFTLRKKSIMLNGLEAYFRSL